MRFHQQLYGPALLETNCFNCGNVHSMRCEFPTYFSRCYRCLVISFDGSGHTPPCAPENTISEICKDIFAKSPLPLLKLRLDKSECDIHYLNINSGQFEEFSDCQVLLSSATDGIFSFKEAKHYGILSYDATSFMRMTFVVAVLDSANIWRIRFRGILTEKVKLKRFFDNRLNGLNETKPKPVKSFYSQRVDTKLGN